MISETAIKDNLLKLSGIIIVSERSFVSRHHFRLSPEVILKNSNFEKNVYQKVITSEAVPSWNIKKYCPHRISKS
jgi:hypothetical protein